MNKPLSHRPPDRGGGCRLTMRAGCSLTTAPIRVAEQSRLWFPSPLCGYIDAWVVLPDHLHCVWTVPPGDNDFSNRWKAIKIRFVQALPRTERRSKVRIAKGERAIWQRRFWEHVIRDERDYAQQVDYVHLNPLKHGYVQRVADWPHSTFHRYVAAGLLPTNWCGEIEDLATVPEIMDMAHL